MHLSRRALVAGAAVVQPFAATTDARAQAWPSRPLRLVIPFPPRGAQNAEYERSGQVIRAAGIKSE